MGRRRTATTLVVALGFVLSSTAAYAVFSAVAGSQTNSATAGGLGTPATPTSIHPNVTGTHDGDVKLSWTDTISITTQTVSYKIMRAPASSPSSFSTIDTQTSGSVCDAATGSVNCNYTDTTAAYNSGYVYKIQSTVGGWTATSATNAALSIPPSSATDTTAGSGADLMSVAAVSSTAIWAVGQNCTVLFGNGTTWTPATAVPASCTNAGTTLNGVTTVTASGSVWIVGANGTILTCLSSCTSAGATWTTPTSGTTKALKSVTAAQTGTGSGRTSWVYASGADGTVIACTVAFGNGTNTCANASGTWNSVGPNTSSLTLAGISVLGGTGTDVWAVGSTGAGAGAVLSCNGNANCATANTNWKTISAAPTTNGYNGVAAVSTTQVYVVGNSGTALLCLTTCGSAAGSTWTAIAGTGAGTTNLNGVAYVSNTSVTVVGASGFVTVCSANCQTTGSGTWAQPTIPGNPGQSLNGVGAADSTHVWAVGNNGTILFSGVPAGAWSTQSSGVSVALNGAVAMSSTAVWAVGQNCTVLFGNGTSWTPATALPASCTTAGTNLNAVATVSASGSVWIVGDSGTILTCLSSCNSAAATWTTPTSGTTKQLKSVTAAQSGSGNGRTSFVYASGTDGTIVACTVMFGNGTNTCANGSGTWNSVGPGTAGLTLAGISVNPSTGVDVWAAGTLAGAGVVRRCTGAPSNCPTSSTNWAAITTAPSTNGYNGVTAVGANQVYLVGASGTALICGSSCTSTTSTWTSIAGVTAGTTNLNSLAFSDNTHAWVVGDGGFLKVCSASCSTSGSTWAAPTIIGNPSQTLNSVTFADNSNVWAVGVNGIILFSGASPGAWSPQTSGITSYSLQAADITALTMPDGSSYGLQAAWATGTTLPTACTFAQGLRVAFNPTIPAGTTITTAKATVEFKNSAKPTNSAMQLMVSGNSGSSWTAFPLTTPNANTDSVQTVAIQSVISDETKLGNMRVCLQGVGGVSTMSTTVDLVHVDVN